MAEPLAAQAPVGGVEPLSEKIEAVASVEPSATGQTTPAVVSEKAAETTLPAAAGTDAAAESKTEEKAKEQTEGSQAQSSQSIAQEPKIDEPKQDEPNAAEQKVEAPKSDEPKSEESKSDEPKTEESKTEQPPPVPPKEEPTSVSSSILTAEAENGNVKTVPFAFPAANCKPASRPKLTQDQQIKYDDLLIYCRDLKAIPVSSEKKAEEKPLNEKEQMWLTEECLLRFLRAVKWNLNEAKKRITGTLVWRREWGVWEHTAEYIEIENRTGKQVIMGYDNEARPCLYLNPARQNTDRSHKQIEHLVFMVERVLDISPPGQETLALLTDFSSTSSGKTPPMWQGKQTLNILQTHYPERLGRALVVNIPWFVWGFFKIITPFIDPLTREKLKFNEKLAQHVPVSQLLKEFGGEIELTYDHERYWPALIKLAEQRREEMTKRWKENGSKIGESEFYLKGGETEVIPAPVEAKPAPEVTAETALAATTAEAAAPASTSKESPAPAPDSLSTSTPAPANDPTVEEVKDGVSSIRV